MPQKSRCAPLPSCPFLCLQLHERMNCLVPGTPCSPRCNTLLLPLFFFLFSWLLLSSIFSLLPASYLLLFINSPPPLMPPAVRSFFPSKPRPLYLPFKSTSLHIHPFSAAVVLWRRILIRSNFYKGGVGGPLTTANHPTLSLCYSGTGSRFL